MQNQHKVASDLQSSTHVNLLANQDGA